MDEKKQKAIQGLRQTIAWTEEQIKYVELLPDDLPGTIKATFAGIIINLPYELETIRKTRMMLGENYKLNGAPTVSKSGEWFMSLRAKQTDLPDSILIIASPERAGSTCRKVIDHYEQKPVYKIVCDGEQNES